jgi:hypothetical protein
MSPFPLAFAIAFSYVVTAPSPLSHPSAGDGSPSNNGSTATDVRRESQVSSFSHPNQQGEKRKKELEAKIPHSNHLGSTRMGEMISGWNTAAWFVALIMRA